MIFPCPAQAPEIFQIPLDDLDPAGLPPRGTAEFEQAAFDRFAKLDQAKVGQIVMEIALLGRNGLEINKPAVRYTLQNLEGEFSGLALLAYMHVGFRMFDPKGDAGTGLDREYEAAVKMRRER